MKTLEVVRARIEKKRGRAEEERIINGRTVRKSKNEEGEQRDGRRSIIS